MNEPHQPPSLFEPLKAVPGFGWLIIGALAIFAAAWVFDPAAFRPMAASSAVATPLVPRREETLLSPPTTAISDAAREALKRGRRQAANPGKIDRRWSGEVAVDFESRDRYGNETRIEGISFVWRREDLDRVNWRGIDNLGLLDLADHGEMFVKSPDAMAQLNVWCARRAVLTPRLCAEVEKRGRGD